MNQQLEFKYFWPLTEQTNLELDFAPCVAYEQERIAKLYAGTTCTNVLMTAGTGITSVNGTWATVDPTFQNFQVLPDGAVGSWQVTPNMSVGRKSKPNFVHRFFTKLVLGWEWKDKQ